MPVHRHHRVVHVHIPKAAGTAIGGLFDRLGDFEWSRAGWYGQQQIDGRHYELQHLSFLELRALAGHRFDGFDVFASVRDPYQRLISEFHWRRAVGGDDDDTVCAYDTFDDLVAAIPLDIDHEWNQYIAVADRIHANVLIHLRPQWHYVCDTSGRRDDRIEIVRFEHLADDMAPLIERWGAAERFEARTPRPKSIAEYFSTESLAVVNQVYARDFEWFGYPMLTDPS